MWQVQEAPRMEQDLFSCTVSISSVWLLDLTFKKTAHVMFHLWSVTALLPAEASVMGTSMTVAVWLGGWEFFYWRRKLGICLQEWS